MTLDTTSRTNCAAASTSAVVANNFAMDKIEFRIRGHPSLRKNEFNQI